MTAEKDYRRLATRCPAHGAWDCSPLLNGCSMPIYLNRAFDAGRLSGVREAQDEIGRMLDTFPQKGRHTRARWAYEWLGHIAGRMSLPPEVES